MVRLHNDVLVGLDDGYAFLIVCIDMSAAFDTVNHQIMLQRLEQRLGIKGTCLKWFESYLTNRKQAVIINGTPSKSKDLCCGVPQGSVLGPKLYNIYTLPLGEIIAKHNVSRIFYADDGNLYLAFRQNQFDYTKANMEHLVVDLKSFFVANDLMSNDDKLIAMVVNGTRRHPIIFPTLSVGDVEVPMSLVARILGVHIDSTMSMSEQVKKVTKACFLQLHKMYKIRECVDEDSAKCMVHSLVTSRLDYCNALLYGCPNVLLDRLWCVQKAGARLITMSGKYDHITPVLIKLHMLPVHQRLDYKVLLLTYKSLNNMAPIYLTELLEHRTNKGTRRDNMNLLVEPRFKCKTYGGRAFSRSAPVLWNRLPANVRDCTTLSSFKTSLKTYLFKKAFNL